MPAIHAPTLRDVAKAAGVSMMSVSNALRGRGRMTPETREQIRRVATELNYRPDPLVTHLMSHVRRRRLRNTQANLGVMMFGEQAYSAKLLQGIKRRADETGYSIDCIDVLQLEQHPRALERMLHARGIEGLLLAPAKPPRDLEGLLRWENYSVVAMTYSIPRPAFHRVVPHHFHNAMLVLQKLRELGFRRPSFLIQNESDVRANHAYSAAQLWDWTYTAAAGAPVPLFLAREPRLKGAGAWFREHRPDAVIGINRGFLRSCFLPQLDAADRGSVRVFAMDCGPDVRSPGVDQGVQQIGATALDMLIAQIQRGEKGVPARPTVAMIEGLWIPPGEGGFELAPAASRKPGRSGASPRPRGAAV